MAHWSKTILIPAKASAPSAILAVALFLSSAQKNMQTRYWLGSNLAQERR